MFFYKYTHLPSETNPVRRWVSGKSDDFLRLFAPRGLVADTPRWDFDDAALRGELSGFQKAGDTLDTKTVEATWGRSLPIEVFTHPSRGFYAIDSRNQIVGGIVDGSVQTRASIAADHDAFIRFFATCFSVIHEQGWDSGWKPRERLSIPQRPDLSAAGFFRHVFFQLQTIAAETWNKAITPEALRVPLGRAPIHQIPLRMFAAESDFTFPDSIADTRVGIDMDWDENWRVVDLHDGYTARYRPGASFYLLVSPTHQIVGRCGSGFKNDIESFGPTGAAAYILPAHRKKGLYAAAMLKLWDRMDCLRMETFIGAGYTADTARSHKAIHRKAIEMAIQNGECVPAYAVEGHAGLEKYANILTDMALLHRPVDRDPKIGDFFFADVTPQGNGPTRAAGDIDPVWKLATIAEIPGEQEFLEPYGILKVKGTDGTTYWLKQSSSSEGKSWRSVDYILPAANDLALAQEAGCDDDEIDQWILNRNSLPAIG